jgi:two-component system chemotaxis response regulator CheY
MLRAILTVDDSALIHHMVGLFLSRFRGTRLLNAIDGAAALEVLSREPEVDLILLDINMPVMNGLELLTRLRQEEAYRRIPVVVITTQGSEQDEERCLVMGAQAYLRKPFQTADLHRIIEQVTGERPS